MAQPAGSRLDASACRSLADLLRLRALGQPDRLACRFLGDGENESARLTYGQLDGQARSIARMLSERRVEKKCILLLYPQGPEFLTALAGCFYSGAIGVPAYSPHVAFLKRSLPRIAAIVQDVEPVAALTTTHTLEALLQLMADFPTLRRLQWMTTDGLEQPSPDDRGLAPIDENDIAFIQYTSGSTREPKGIMLTHGNLLAHCRLMKQRLGWDERLAGVSWLPLFHDMGLIGSALQPFYVGGHCTIMSPFHFLQRPARWLEAISRFRANCSPAPNFAFDLCARNADPGSAAALDLSCWEVALCGAEAVQRDTIERFVAAFGGFGFRREAFVPCYGLAEATLMVTGGPRGRSPVYHSVSGSERLDGTKGALTLVGCGKSLPEQTVLIVDPERRLPRASGEIGEIWVSGPSVGRGYWRHPEETGEIFQASLEDGRGPFLRTGDLGFLVDDELFVSGRLKDLIIIGGQNHFPQDIEWTVQQCHPSIRPYCSAAFSVPIDGQEQLVVVAEVERRVADRGMPGGAERRRSPRPPADPPRPPFDPAAVERAIRSAVSQGHGLAIHAVVLVRPGSIPKTSSGKTQHRLCRQMFLEARLQPL